MSEFSSAKTGRSGGTQNDWKIGWHYTQGNRLRGDGIMVTVRLITWSPGLKKVQLTKCIRSAAGMSLDQSHDAVNRLLAGEIVEILISSEPVAQQFATEARALGVTVEFPAMTVSAE